ncbi:MAG TPA: hypothetical protein VF365_05875 [Candidatus Limnocylindria bacterium]
MNEPSAPERSATSSGPPGVAVGAILVIIGGILLAGQVLDFGIGDLGWPLIIVAIGVALLLIGLVVAGESGMVVGGAVVTTVGLVLLYQNQTGHWESWAYAWALVGPAASGLGLAIWGIRSGNARDVRNGTWGMLGGLGFFAVGYLFFEGVIGISGQRLPLPEWVLPALVIGIGVVILVRGMLQRGEPEAS